MIEFELYKNNRVQVNTSDFGYLAALKEFRNNGSDQAASDLISYINTSFPNDTIPADLLD